VAVACALALSSASASEAAVKCSYKGSSHRLEVVLTKGGDIAVAVAEADAIEIHRTSPSGGLVNCSGAAATTANTDRVAVDDDTAKGSTQFGLDLPSAFEPGFTEETGVDEIEFVVDLGKGRNDVFSISSDPGVDDSLVFGRDGINLNAGTPGESVTPDADLTGAGIEEHNLNLGDGQNSLSGDGDSGTGEPFTRALSAVGGTNADEFEGGDGDDHLSTFGGADVLDGSDGDDLLAGGDGDDDLDGALGDDLLIGGLDADELTGDPVLVPAGGAGQDTVSYAERDDPSDTQIGLDLDDASGDDGSADDGSAGNRDSIIRVDNVVGTGSSFADFFVGNASENVFDGGPGPDQILGGGDDDLVSYAERSEDVTVALGGPPVGQGGASDGVGDSVAEIEGAIGGSGDDALSADPGASFGVTFDGGGGDDVLSGGPLDDLLIGGRAQDRLLGNDGIDTLRAKDRRRDKRIDCGDGANSQEAAKFDRGIDPAPISC
jgi:Ca2+-binding RTX toxin-like protein